MSINRREFVAATLATAGLTAISSLVNASTFSTKKKLDILFLGGTGFLGPHTVRYALTRGHSVTLFNRGKTNSKLFPQLESIIGDRDPKKGKGLAGLIDRKWDAVIDTSGYVPRIVGASSNLLANSVKQYLFVSTICQYDNWAEGEKMGTENRASAKLDDPKTENVGEHYCALKGYCEQAAEKSMPRRITQIRPGLIVGPRDKSDRFTYWPVRFERGGEILAPGKPEDYTQFIDVRDLAQFMVLSLESKLTGTYNLVAPHRPFGDLVDSCLRVCDNDAKVTWVTPEFMEKNDVKPWQDIHMWADSNGSSAGALTWSSKKAIHAGLTFRPIDETVADTLTWFKSLPEKRQAKLRAGMSQEKETKVLKAWHLSQKKSK